MITHTVRVVALLVALLFSSVLVRGTHAAPTVQTDASSSESSASVRLIVKFYDDGDGEVRAAATQQLHADAGAILIASGSSLNADVVGVPADGVETAIAIYDSDPAVAYVEIDHVAAGQVVPNDQYYATAQYAPQLIQADLAWDITAGDASIVVAVVDSGADFSHPDLEGKLIVGWDFVNSDADPSDDYGHGTHVSGIVAAKVNNGIGVAGIGNETRVLVVKVLDQNNAGFYSQIADGITYAADQGARIINLSLGGTAPSQYLQDAVDYAWNGGALVVASAGNYGTDAPVYPAYYSSTMAVSATDHNDEFWSSSTYGDFIEISAPGRTIYSTDWSGGAGAYASRSGTSMAAPHVSAIAALALARNSGLSNSELRSLLVGGTDDFGDAGWDVYYGAGRIDALAVISSVTGTRWRRRTGTDRNVFTDAGTDRNAFTDAGADRNAFTDAGADRNAFTDAGADRNAFTDAGTDRNVFTDAGTDQHTAAVQRQEVFYTETDSNHWTDRDTAADLRTDGNQRADRDAATDLRTDRDTATDSPLRG